VLRFTTLPGNLGLDNAGAIMKRGSVFLSATLGSAVTVAWALTASGAHANLVQNPTFSNCQQSTCPGWTVTQAASGSDIGFLSPDALFGASQGQDDQLSQVITTVSGDTYKISFTLRATNNFQSNFSAQFSANNILSFTNNLPTTATAYTFNIVATGASTTLSFLGYNKLAFDYLRDISVINLSAAPGPTAGEGLFSAALILVIGFAARFRSFVI
jgi:hypothetical protein